MLSTLQRLFALAIADRVTLLMMVVMAFLVVGADAARAQDCTPGPFGRRTCCVSQTPSDDLRCQGDTATMRFVYSDTFSVNRITWEAFHRRTDGTEHFFAGGIGSEAVLNILSTPSASGEYQVRFVEEYLNPETLLWEGACTELQPQIVSRWVRFTHIPGTEIQAQPTSVSFCQGRNFEAYFDVTGASSYRWYKRVNGGSPVALVNDGQRIFGTDTPRLSINNVGPVDAGAYYCRITNSVSTCGPTQSNDATLTVNTASATYVSGGDRFESVCAGATVSLPLNYTGTGIQYRWYLLQTDGSKRYITSNGSLFGGSTVVSGVDTNTLTLTNVGSTNTPVRYGCTVSAICFSEDRIVCQLTVTTPLRIDTNISDQQMCIGQSTNELMTFGVSPLSGTGQIYYRWYKFGGSGSPLTNTFPYSGTTGPTLGIDRNATQAQINGPFYCVASQDPTFSNPCGWVISNVAMIWASSTGPTITNPFSNITICRGGRAAFGVDPQGGVTYEWQLLVSNTWTTPVDGTTAAGSVVSGQGTNVLTIDNSQGDVTTVLLRVTNACTSVASLQASLNTRDAATVAAPTMAVSSDCVPTLATLSVPTVAGAQYQWLRNGVALSNDTNYSNVTTRTLTAKRRIEDFNASFACRVDNGCSLATSSSITIPIHVPAVIVGHPAAVAACAGTSATFTVATSGPGPFTYRWRRNGQDVVVNGTTGWETATFTIHSVDSSRTGSYTCRVRNACGDVFSQAAELTMASTSTTITSQPVDIAICAGGSTSFSVAATGTGLSYQWQSSTTSSGPWTDVANSGEIVGATTPTLMLAEQSGLVGMYFRCRVTACSSPVFSNAARILSVDSVPVAVTTHPVSRTVCAQSSSPVILSVAASGSNPAYRWKRNGADLSDRPGLTGAMTPTLTITPPVATDSGTYTCTVSNACGAATSNPAELVVETPGVFSVQPVARVACAGGTVTFTVAATGSNLTYRWQSQALTGGSYFGMNDSATIAGSTSPTLTVTGLTAADARNYRCRVTNSCGTVASAAATLTLEAPVVITTQPANTLGCTGGTTSMTVAATGTNLAYQWTRNGINVTDGTGVSGATTPTIILSNLTSANSGSYRCRVTNPCGSVLSNTADLTVNPTPIATQPSPQSACSGSPASFSVVASDPAATYQWQRSGINLSNGPTVSGATAATLNLLSTDASSAGDYRCVVTTPQCGPVPTSAVALTLQNPAEITSQPVAQSACGAAPATFMVAASGIGLSYRWELREAGQAFVSIPAGNSTYLGANFTSTNQTLTITNVNAAVAIEYRCVVSNLCGDVNTNIVQLSINPGPSITQQPEPTVVCRTASGALVGFPRFSVVASGTGLTYRWQRGTTNLNDGIGVSGATTPNLTLSSSALVLANYRCVVTSSCGTTFTTSVPLTAASFPTITTPPQIARTCRTQPAIFTVVATGTGTLTYRWFWRPPGATTQIQLVDGMNSFGDTARLLASGVNTPTVSLTPLAGPLSLPIQSFVTVANECTRQSDTTLNVCPGDFNCSGALTLQDVFDYLNAFFNSDPTADFNQSGDISTQDIFDMLNAYFAGCS